MESPYLAIINNDPRAHKGVGGVLEYTFCYMCHMIKLPFIILDNSDFSVDFIRKNSNNIAGFIFTGSKKRIHQATLEDSFLMSDILLNYSNKPIMGLCFGHQSISRLNGAKISSYDIEGGIFHGHLPVTIDKNLPIMKGVKDKTNSFIFWHYDFVTSVPDGYRVLDWGENRGKRFIFAMKHKTKNIYGFQFHVDNKNKIKDTYNIYFNFFDMCGLKYNPNLLNLDLLSQIDKIAPYNLTPLMPTF